MLKKLRPTMASEDGFSLIELLVVMVLFAILSGLLILVVLSSASNLKTVRETSDLNEESRLVMNRVSREIREAQSIILATNPVGSSFNPNGDVSITFQVDFDGDNVIEPNAADAEELTYLYDRDNRRLLLQTPATTLPILAANVETFKLSYESSLFECDTNTDGTVTWEEMDAAPSPCKANGGASDGALNAELTSVDAIIVELTVLTGPRRQDYRTRVFLRNH